MFSNIEIAQIAYDSTVVISLLLTIMFLPFLSVLIYIQTGNFIAGKTTTVRFTKNRRTNVSEQMISALADDDSEPEENEDVGMRQGTPHNRSMSQITRLSTLDEHNTESCITNCSNMFCGSGHFNKQERVISKFVADKKQRKMLKGDAQIEDMQQSLINEEAEFNRHANN